jgi:predicted permease
MTSLKPLPELNSKKSTLIFSKRPLSHSNSLLKVLMLKRLILMKLSWSVVQQESQKSDNWLNNSSMVKNPTQVSILMRLFAMVLPFKVVSFADKTLKMEELSSLMLPHFLLVLKLSVVL